jgi:Cys-tRNA(Pro)/Cys-tRNA(Cys) deacylase
MRTSVDVHNFLLERDVPHELVPVRGRLREPERTAAVLGLPPEEVGRVVVLEAAKALVAVVIPAGTQPDLRRVAVATPSPSLVELDPDRVAEVTDYLAEAVPPVGLPEGTKVILDRSVAEQEVLYIAGGEPSTLLKIRPADLVRATGAKVAKVAR